MWQPLTHLHSFVESLQILMERARSQSAGSKRKDTWIKNCEKFANHITIFGSLTRGVDKSLVMWRENCIKRWNSLDSTQQAIMKNLGVRPAKDKVDYSTRWECCNQQNTANKKRCGICFRWRGGRKPPSNKKGTKSAAKKRTSR